MSNTILTPEVEIMIEGTCRLGGGNDGSISWAKQWLKFFVNNPEILKAQGLYTQQEVDELKKDLDWWKREESIKCELIIELREKQHKTSQQERRDIAEKAIRDFAEDYPTTEYEIQEYLDITYPLNKKNITNE